MLGSPASNGIVCDWWGHVKVFGSGRDDAKTLEGELIADVETV